MLHKLNILDSDYVAHLDGFTTIPGGGISGHWMQLAYQLADSVSGFAYSFGGTCLILFLINLMPGLGLRADEEAEIIGMDDAEIGEFAVSRSTKTSPTSVANVVKYDFVEFTRDVVNGGDMLDDESKFSADRDSLTAHEKAFSSTVGDDPRRSR